MAKCDPSLPLLVKAQEVYAFERSLGIQPSEAVRRAGGNPRSGTVTKWERSPRIQARIRHLRALGHDDEMLAAKRQRIEERLELAAFGNILDFAEIDGTTNLPEIDWREVKNSPLAVIISEFAFDKDTGQLVRFKRDDALAAAAQLRDMHGFKAPSKTALTDPTGSKAMDLPPINIASLTNAQLDILINRIVAGLGPAAGGAESRA